MEIGIPVYNKVDLLDVTGPYEIFSWMTNNGMDAKVHLIAETTADVTTRDGFTFKPHKTFGEAPALDLLFVPGGAPSVLKELMSGPNRSYLEFLKKQSRHARYTASVCEGALLLAAAGLLDGYKATTHWQFIPCLKEFPKIDVAPGYPRFVVDRNRVTGGGISSGLDEALELVKLLSSVEVAEKIQQQTQYYPSPPVNSKIPGTTKCPFSWN